MTAPNNAKGSSMLKKDSGRGTILVQMRSIVGTKASCPVSPARSIHDVKICQADTFRLRVSQKIKLSICSEAFPKFQSRSRAATIVKTKTSIYVKLILLVFIIALFPQQNIELLMGRVV